MGGGGRLVLKKQSFFADLITKPSRCSLKSARQPRQAHTPRFSTPSGAKLATAAGSATLPSPSKPQRSAALTAASSGSRPASRSTQAQPQLSRALWCSAVPNPGQFHFKEAPRAPTVANRLYAGDKPRLRGGKREGQARAKPRPLSLTRSCSGSGWRLSRRASFFFFLCFWRSTLAVPRNKSC